MHPVVLPLHRAEDGDPGKRATLRHNEPPGNRRRLRALGMMELADYQVKFVTTFWRKSSKGRSIRSDPKLLKGLVAGGGFEPPTFGL
jgi:hypothetical protein